MEPKCVGSGTVVTEVAAMVAVPMTVVVRVAVLVVVVVVVVVAGVVVLGVVVAVAALVFPHAASPARWYTYCGLL